MEAPRISARQLRQILFGIDNQKMTVEELRRLLYDVTDQDREVEAGPNTLRDLTGRPTVYRYGQQRVTDARVDHAEESPLCEAEFGR